jgi:hypothetical protein
MRILAYHSVILRAFQAHPLHPTFGIMEADDTTKNAVQLLIEAIQLSVDTSPGVKSAVENLERLGYIPNFTVRMDLELMRPFVEKLTDTRVRLA